MEHGQGGLPAYGDNGSSRGQRDVRRGGNGNNNYGQHLEPQLSFSDAGSLQQFQQHHMQPPRHSLNDGGMGMGMPTYGGNQNQHAVQQHQRSATHQPPHQQLHSQQYSNNNNNNSYNQHVHQHQADPQQSSSAAVGWGGQSLHDSAGQRVPWFGRNRSKFSRGGAPAYPNGSKDGSHASSGGSHVWEAGSYAQNMHLNGSNAHQAPLEGALSVEEIVSLIVKLRRYDPLPDTVFRALAHLDSR